jgi:uncharacterized protein (DUF1697 family)
VTTLVALLRAINVGGTGILPMRELATLCTDAGFGGVRTYIQSGNVVFRSRLAAERARTTLERVLEKRMGKPVGVIIRDEPDLRRVLRANPFPDASGSRVMVMFCAEAVSAAAFDGLTGPAGEQVVAGAREVYIHYPEGMGPSKLKLPKVACVTTTRNINTVTKLVAMCGEAG